jgi:hypothetical protein
MNFCRSTMGSQWSREFAIQTSAVLFALCASIGCGSAGSERAIDSLTEKQPSGATNQEAILPAPKFTGELVLTLSVDTTSQAGPRLTGETNLPDGTVLSASITPTIGVGSYQAEAVVNAGRYTAGPFAEGGGLPPGTYEASVLLAAGRIQPASVETAIGARGEKLRGPLVKRDPRLGASANVEVAFTIGGAAGVAAARAADVAHQHEAKAIYQGLARLLPKGRAMDRLRRSDNLAKLRACGVEMRANLPQADEYFARADSLPHPYRVVVAAAIEMRMCLTCANDANESCDRAAESLRDAKEALAEKRP